MEAVDQQAAVIDPRRFRRVLGHYPTGVCVVTAMCRNGSVGMTVGSFTSVSLDPPLVAFLAGKRSTTWPKIRSAGAFCANVLTEDQRAICRIFATRDVDKFAEVDWEPAGSGAPILHGALAWIDCDIEQVHEAGDHYIVLGRVRDLDIANSAAPLAFFQAGYGRFVPEEISAANGDVIAHLRTAELARDAMETLGRTIGAECTASVPIGDEVVVVASTSGPLGEIATRVGHRIAFVPPIGMPFIAWAEQTSAVDTWLRRAEPELTPPEIAMYRHALARVRASACVIVLGSRAAGRLDALLLETRFASRADIASARRSVVLAPVELAPDGRYDIATVSAPVFDSAGRVSMTITAHGFDDDRSGAEVESHAQLLAECCGRITRVTGGRPPSLT